MHLPKYNFCISDDLHQKIMLSHENYLFQLQINVIRGYLEQERQQSGLPVEQILISTRLEKIGILLYINVAHAMCIMRRLISPPSAKLETFRPLRSTL